MCVLGVYYVASALDTLPKVNKTGCDEVIIHFQSLFEVSLTHGSVNWIIISYLSLHINAASNRSIVTIVINNFV